MKLDYVVIYYLKDGVRLLKPRLYLHKMGIDFSEVKLSEYVVGLEELAKARNIENEKVKDFVEDIKKNKDNEYSYICRFIKHNNYIIRYKNGNDIYLSIGKDKKTWKKWFNG